MGWYVTRTCCPWGERWPCPSRGQGRPKGRPTEIQGEMLQRKLYVLRTLVGSSKGCSGREDASVYNDLSHISWVSSVTVCLLQWSATWDDVCVWTGQAEALCYLISTSIRGLKQSLESSTATLCCLTSWLCASKLHFDAHSVKACLDLSVLCF